MQERTTEEPNQRKAKAVSLLPSYSFDGIGQALRLSFPPHAPADCPPDIAALLAELSCGPPT